MLSSRLPGRQGAEGALCVVCERKQEDAGWLPAAAGRQEVEARADGRRGREGGEDVGGARARGGLRGGALVLLTCAHLLSEWCNCSTKSLLLLFKLYS